ncbi:MAG: hypothetical protein A3G32_01680 [Deltaproteobacteria bacterium RIFCSPLOWO2_12_FULL_40_28]|nr:MAG: hypothetical protein A3C45_06425 [Deltaproteobacteria bacterium RIFCSPHIGHO2_02_FULL_40_28]OGQ18842.1 MAG: hypothetical protein A3E27_09060 [Deltaproteobacteria bacterium RIFCSPHIGHO2_12_FULL_40_32]OGQ40087.1 MAG: hypothetical protein A3I69_01590 [Deltaproteobacteria bacterium RIFCSPLOWO2_02_FULL_40_36]OGQ53270.1 MAG: hypothetical protein A3G32_01680 [Deltaproteobacteria bacterium RIFCSPLOWO2_12_FULL_40_28]
MESLTYSQARAQFAKALDKVCKDHKPLLITRQKGGAAILLSVDDFEALEETAYLLRSPKNAKILLESVEELESGKGKKKKI